MHEVAHVHDRAAGYTFSRDPRFLDLAGWQVRPLRFGTRSPRNPFTDRSPDAYERTSPAEFFAVNVEHLLLDPAYACRRPALHRHFVATFGALPSTEACPPDQAFVEADAASGRDADAEALLALDPARVFEVDYLLADANAQPMSRWGHTMLRLVVCAPGRAPGPDCRLDLQHHRVLSFRAWVDDVQVSSWRGLTGRYPSRLFVLPMEQVIDEYTQVELRGLQSIPLRLDRTEIAALLERAATVHWTYDGRYAFVGNNCAVETWKLLHDALPRLASAPLRSITPRGLLKRLARAGVADTSVLERPDAASAGYWFAPASAHYQRMFEVARSSLALLQARVEDWLATDPAVRAPVFERADLRASAALLLLERAAARREELQARDQIKRVMLAAGRDTTGDALHATVRALLAEGALLGRPASLLQDAPGYGLPQLAERGQVAAEAGPRRTRLQTQSAQLEADARASLPSATRARIAAIDRNLATLDARLRRLAADAEVTTPSGAP